MTRQVKENPENLQIYAGHSPSDDEPDKDKEGQLL
jgi:hypothetical protein